MDIILSTRNPSKAKQIRAIFESLPLKVLTLDEAGIAGQGFEDGETLEHNGLKKALYAWEHSGHKWCMSDDTGLFIEALGGFPGVHAADWLGEATTEEIMCGILKKMEGIENRAAIFRTVATLVAPDGTVRTFEGEVHGRLLAEPGAQAQKNMPYSPLFVVDGKDVPWAQMSVEEENAVSHRGKAFRLVREYLETLL